MFSRLIFIKIRTMLYIDVQTDFVPIYSILAVSILFITAEDTYGEYFFFYEIMFTIYFEYFLIVLLEFQYRRGYEIKQRKRKRAQNQVQKDSGRILET